MQLFGFVQYFTAQMANLPVVLHFWSQCMVLILTKRFTHFPAFTGMSRPMSLFEAQQPSSRTVDPEVCLPAFLWRDLAWSNAKTPTGSASDSSLSLRLSELIGHGLHFWVFLIHRFYSRDIRASGILNGDVEPPYECSDLYHILEEYTKAYTADWTSKNMHPKVTEGIIEINSLHSSRRWTQFLCVLSFQSSGPPSRPPAPPQQRASASYEPPTADGDCDAFLNANICFFWWR